MIDSFVLLAYATSAASRTLLQRLSARLNFSLDPEDLFCRYKRKNWFLRIIAAAQVAENHGSEWCLTLCLQRGIYRSILWNIDSISQASGTESCARMRNNFHLQIVQSFSEEKLVFFKKKKLLFWLQSSPFSTGASNRSFNPVLNKRFDHLETLLTICRPKKVLSAGSLCGPLVPSQQSKCPKRIFVTSKVSCFSYKYVIKAIEIFHGKRNLT